MQGLRVATVSIRVVVRLLMRRQPLPTSRLMDSLPENLVRFPNQRHCLRLPDWQRAAAWAFCVAKRSRINRESQNSWKQSKAVALRHSFFCFLLSVHGIFSSSWFAINQKKSPIWYFCMSGFWDWRMRQLRGCMFQIFFGETKLKPSWNAWIIGGKVSL